MQITALRVNLLFCLVVAGCGGEGGSEPLVAGGSQEHSLNKPPIFTSLACPELALVGETLTLSCACSDPDGRDPHVSWDIQCLGVTVATQTGKSAIVPLRESGPYQVRLVATDAVGGIAQLERTIMVETVPQRDERIGNFLKGDWRIQLEGYNLVVRIRDAGILNGTIESTEGTNALLTMMKADMGDMKGTWRVEKSALELCWTGVEKPLWDVLLNLLPSSDFHKVNRVQLEIVDKNTVILNNADGTRDTLRRL
jgi:hypothetical protein